MLLNNFPRINDAFQPFFFWLATLGVRLSCQLKQKEIKQAEVELPSRNYLVDSKKKKFW